MRLGHKIGVDVDGVLANFTEVFTKIILEIEPDRQDWLTMVPTDWDYKNYNMKPGTLKAGFAKIAETVDFWETLTVLPNTHLLRYLFSENQVTFVTNRAPAAGKSVALQTCNWLKSRFDLSWADVVVTKDKGKIAKTLDLVYFIDDNVPNCLDLLDHGIKVSLLDQPWNQEYVDPRLPRVQTFDDWAYQVSGGKVECVSGAIAR